MDVEHNRINGFVQERSNQTSRRLSSYSNSASEGLVMHAVPAARIGAARRSFWPWPGLVFVLLGANVSVVVVTIYLATNDPSFAVEPDYYRKAVNWDQTAAQRERNRVLGWIVEAPAGSTGMPIALTMRDHDGTLISGAQVRVTAFHNASAHNRLETTLSEIEPGLYRSNETLTRPGDWELRLVAERVGDVFTASLPLLVSDGGHAP